jgi:hypothetical protein
MLPLAQISIGAFNIPNFEKRDKIEKEFLYTQRVVFCLHSAIYRNTWNKDFIYSNF